MHTTITASLFALLICSTALASTLNVPQDYTTIQAAIDAAVAGDTVLVAPGTYLENIDFKGKAITVQSSSGWPVTTIDGGERGSVVSFVSGEVRDSVLDGFTITRGSGTAVGDHLWKGGGIYCAGSSPFIRNNCICGNEVYDGQGGGISCDSAARIEGNLILANTAFGPGGGIECDAGTEIVDNAIRDNVAWHEGAGVLAKGDVLIDGNTISWNWVSNGLVGGISISRTSMFSRITNNHVSNNFSADGTGGISCGGGLIAGNVVEYNDGAGVGGIDCGAAMIKSNVIRFNFGFGDGGGIAASAGAILENNLIAGNSGLTWGGVSTRGQVINCTVVNNESFGGWGAGGVEGVAAISGSVIWGNSEPQLANAKATYSDVQGGWPGTGNFDADPLFIDPANGDYSLAATSPCVDAGDPADHSSGVDLAGNPRRLDGHLTGVPRVEVGAYEFGNVHLAITGRATPGGTVTVDTTGTAGLRVVLLFGTEPAEAYFYPYGPLFFGLASPWTAVEWGQIPSSVQATIPADVPAPLPLIVQELALDHASGAGNTSNAVIVTIE